MPVYLLDGQVLLGEDGHVAYSADCCCAGGGCSSCGDRLTATFSGVADSFCAGDYEWPMGMIQGAPIFGYSAYVDGGTGAVPCLGFDGAVEIDINCEDGGGWFINASDGATTFFSSTSFSGSLPIGIPISNDLINGGTITLACGGGWGSCCGINVPGVAEVCLNCADGSSGLPGGVGQVQCETLLGSNFYPTFGAFWNGDHSTCATAPCIGFAAC